MSITSSVRLRLLLIPVAAAALTVGCGEGNVLQSPTGPSSTLGSGTSLTADDADGVVATAASTDEFGTLDKGGNGKDKENGHGNGKDNGGGDSEDDDDDGDSDSRGPGNGNPGRGHDDKVVGFVSATTFDSVTVNGVTIMAAPGAVIRHGNRRLTLGNIGVGDHLQARGTRSGNTLLATEIKVQNTNHEDDDNVGDAVVLEGVDLGSLADGGLPGRAVDIHDRDDQGDDLGDHDVRRCGVHGARQRRPRQGDGNDSCGRLNCWRRRSKLRPVLMKSRAPSSS